MRKKIIAANWKMNMTVNEANSFLDVLLREVGPDTPVEVVIAPPFTALSDVSRHLNAVQHIKVGAQNMSAEKSGAFTGEISGAMLRELFTRYVILGHSERRSLYGETDELVNRKVHTALEATLKPIVCIGETLAQRDAGEVQRVLKRQLEGSLAGLGVKEMHDIVLAYEPVWAIGTGRTATPEQAQEAHAFARATVASLFDQSCAEKVRIQYGGSVKPNNAEALMRLPDIDGALVGGASLDARGFAEIIHATEKAL